MRKARGWLIIVTLLAPGVTAKPTHAPKPPHDDVGAPSNDEVEHVVKAGETIGGVAARAHVPRVLIEEANHLTPPYRLRTGQRLFLPRTRHHTVAAGESSFDIALRYGTPWSAIATANGLKRDAEVKPGQRLLIPTLLPWHGAPARDQSATKATAGAAIREDRHDSGKRFAWPLNGRVVRAFTPRGEADHHDGIDILAPAGSPVRAAAGGEVIFAGDEPQSFGRLVIIDHGKGWQSAYGFLRRATVAKGEHVRANERIGFVGHSGKAPRDELHFEIRHDNKPVDPADRLGPAQTGARLAHHKKAPPAAPRERQ